MTAVTVPEYQLMLADATSRASRQARRIKRLEADLVSLRARLASWETAMPVCSECGGTGGIATASTAPDPYGYITGALIPRPSCLGGGRVTPERAARIVQAVFGDDLGCDHRPRLGVDVDPECARCKTMAPARQLLDYLRSIE